MSTDPEDTLTMHVVAEDTETTETLEPVPETETMPDLPAVTEPVPAQAPEPPKSPAEEPLPIGDALVAEMPGFDILPCGRCGTRYDGAPSDVLRFDRILGPLTVMARQAGWACDGDLVWSCPDCLAGLDKPAARADDGAAEAMRVHLDLLAWADRKFAGAMVARGGEFTCRWEFKEPATDGWWRDEVAA